MPNTVRPMQILIMTLALAAALTGCSRQPAQQAVSPRPPVATTAPPERPTADVDDLVAVGSAAARLHLTCSGAGPATVLVLPGFGDAGDSWGAVLPALRSRSRVCVPSRYGTGTSDAPPSDQTFTTQVRDLRRALEAVGESGPYVVVGHSFGGDEAITFASEFRDEVAGLLLVDASPATWPAAVCAVPDDGSDVARSFRDTCSTISSASANPERLDGRRAFAEVGAIDTLGDLPMRVLTRAEVSYPGLAVERARSLASTWHDGQAHWASLSSASRVVAVASTGHSIQIDQPAAVVEHLSALLP